VGLKDGAVASAAEVIAWSRERMAGYMVPKTVVFRAELPKTSTGKIQKYVLRNLAKEMGPTRRGVSTSTSKM
jgi:acyl-coenzyme A synthetase/AMP-(fatty) acid ligase